MRDKRVLQGLLSAMVLLAGCAQAGPSTPPAPNRPLPADEVTPTVMSLSDAPATPSIIPRPVSLTTAPGFFPLTPGTSIRVDPASPEGMAIGRYLSQRLAPGTGFHLAVVETGQGSAEGAITLTMTAADPSLGDEGYSLEVAPDRVTVAAPHPAGLFHGIQTLLQLLPPSIESKTVQTGPWPIPAVSIRDYPRFEWRGAMLDLARHFFGPEDIRRFIDRMAAYKLNRLHLHLTDDQGWRIAIDSWPNLTAHGGSTAVGGDPGGFLTQSDYAEIVAYAQRAYIVIVPEIDMPGHANAALASYRELNCDGVAPALYTGIEVGFSSLCVGKETTYAFLDDVLGELARLTPGPYLHIGGDEAAATPESDYRIFVERVQAMVEAHGKRMVGWEDIARADLHPTSIAQHWFSDMAARAVERGMQVILSPATRVYLDMQYDSETSLGLHWAGYVEVKDAYAWDPATQVPGVGEKDILGVEAPLWSETVRTLEDVDYLAFPRLVAVAEIGWSPSQAIDWDDFRTRLAAHGPRLKAMGVNFYPSPQIDWE